MMMPERPPSSLEDHLGYWLRFVSNHVSGAFARKLVGMDVMVPEWVVLRELFDGALAPSELAERTGMTRGGVTKLADRLIEKDLVARSADPLDGRRQTLSLTRRGRALTPKLAALADRNDAEFFGHLSAAERKQIEQAMRDVVRRHALTNIPTE